MKKYWPKFCLLSCMAFASTGANSTIVFIDISTHSIISGAAISISANSNVSDDIAAGAAVGVGANSDTANIYAEHAVATGDGGSARDIIAGGAVNIAANASADDIYAVAAVVVGANSSSDNIYSGAAVTLGAQSTSGDVFATAAITGAGYESMNQNTQTDQDINLYRDRLDLTGAIGQITLFQKELADIESDVRLGVTMGDTIFDVGIYSGTAATIAAASTIKFDGKGAENPLWLFNMTAALTVGAGSTFEIINAGQGANVIWNIGGGLGLGADTSFLGSAFVTGAVTGATSSVSCGNLFSLAAVGIGSITSTHCIGNNSWAGSTNGFTHNLNITDGFSVMSDQYSMASVTSVQEPKSAFIFICFALPIALVRIKKIS